MKLFTFPYRWNYDVPSSWWRNIDHAWSDITGGIKNLWRWFPVIWEDRWFDFSYALVILEFKLKYMAERFDEWGLSVNSKQDAKEMRVAAELCRRIHTEDVYYKENTYFKSQKMADIRFKQRAEDMKYLGKMLGRLGLSWWD